MSELVEKFDKGPSDYLDPPSYCRVASIETGKIHDFLYSNLLSHLWLTFSLVNRKQKLFLCLGVFS